MSEFDVQMQQLRAEYRAVVAADLSNLRQQADALRANEDDRATLEQMAATLHRMAGGAGVFGLAQLSEQAHGLELDVSDFLAAALADAYRAALPEFRSGLSRLAVPPEATN